MLHLGRAGKLLSLLFWLVALYNLAAPFSRPFAAAISALAVALLLLHGLQLLMLHAPLGQRRRPWLARLAVLFFGVFALLREDAQPGAAAAVAQPPAP